MDIIQIELKVMGYLPKAQHLYVKNFYEVSFRSPLHLPGGCELDQSLSNNGFKLGAL